MTAWAGNIERITLENPNYRKVIYTGKAMQLVVMTLEPGEEIDFEVHDDIDQFIRVEEGVATLTTSDVKGGTTESVVFGADWATIVSAGTWHKVSNAGLGPLRLYTIYSPPEHADGTIHRTRADADADPHHDH